MNTTPNQQVTDWLAQLDTALTNADLDAATSLFADECYWRDLVAFTWNIKTMEGQDAIKAMLATTLPGTQPSGWQLTEDVTIRQSVSGSMLEGWFRFETAVGHGQGIVRLRDGKCRTILTTLAELKGFEEKRGSQREMGVAHGAFAERKSWLERKAEEEAALGYTEQPYCVIIGGGQGGIALGARLKQLNVPTIIVEKNARPGDSWRNRYKSLCLHDPVWYDHMPYIPFPDHWPVFSPKDKIGDWLEMYTKVMELNYWTSTVCKNAAYDEASQTWTVAVEREGETVILNPKQLVLATGMSGMPNIPDIPGAETFAGTLRHSSKHKGGEGYAGKRCVILGSNNSAHDICADLWENGADVTMIQRSSTMVVKSETLMDVDLGGAYSEKALAAGITHERADMMGAATPYALRHIGGIANCKVMRERDADFYAKLEAAGFMLDYGDDESGLGMKYLRRGSGYYIDVGASDLIISGEIKLKSGVEFAEIKPNSVILTDGTELPADLIVYATGYGSMNEWAAQLISPAVADKVGKCWGIGSDTTKDSGPWEGEQRNMWKPTQQEALLFHGGNLAQSRLYSLYLALQLKARMEGVAGAVYGLAPVYHLR
ncbi:MAG: NAD(P)/FAD-dependent oxidoreductase [Chloroflexota bacterium]